MEDPFLWKLEATWTQTSRLLRELTECGIVHIVGEAPQVSSRVTAEELEEMLR